MKGTERLSAVAVSTPAMARALPQLPMRQTVLVRLLRITVAGMSDYFEPLFRGLDLTEHAFHVLCLLMPAEEGCASPSELSELIGTSRANMTRILDQLAADELVSRRAARRDARRQVIGITPKGRQVCREAAPRVLVPLEAAFSQLDAEEQATLEALLRKVIVSLDKPSVALRSAA